ncbi:receptor-type tyrosine-protein phosphatase S isoform X1 [Syngnathoides biaculeatus]|uniref:receptor-type tyrosine-protein phosphatase S isoform X1 n=2 Tax=Syngnathoides biaculeatus TaxID=300417 RepID=UPI002ADE8E0D|nr:receptor-type tyrosine-protein phosphatase S isoform X1 [Syngnathoides biaculeatus]XP_061680173.1 receptor-type tyrosine-protein phosphatase S isoform X1 [Syngnathoides biaculeatus]XP_061680174.1 receptor-type tyrosine-protein phosphatase S isoform X1 [Syngnathoides biaculeatus]
MATRCAAHLPFPFLLPVTTLLLSLLLTDSHALSPPRFTKVPVDQIGVSGGAVSFVCQATGDPKPRVSWNKKGKKVNSQRIENIEFDEGAGAVLRIQPLRAPRDENIYECVAENSEGEITVNAKLSIIREDLLPPGFPHIDMGPQLKVVERTRTATMLCAASGNPDPEITWYKDFLPIDPTASNGRIKQLRSGALQIENSEETDQGKYECVASNLEGVRYSSPANLYVRVRRVPPRFSIPPTSQEIMPGGSVNITCVAVGSPMPYVKWMLNSEDLTPEDEMPVGRNVLELSGVRESANYTCVAMSSLGIIEAVAQITVKSLPKPPGTPVVTETTATSVTITWDSGNPDPVTYYIIQYRAKSPESKYETVDDITTTRYSIGGLYPNTEYEIRVSAVNTIGQGPPSEPVETRTGEQAPASPPRNIQAQIISQNTMMVRWEDPEEPNGQIKGYRVYYTMDDSQPMSLWQIHNVQDSIITTIQSLVPQETYTIKVLAFTSVGDGPFSDPIHVKVLQGVPGQPSKFQVGDISDTSIELTWEPAFDKEGIISYELRYTEGNFGSQIKKTFGPTSSYIVEGLRPNTEYHFSLAAISNKGIGAFTNDMSQKTLQAKPSAPPQDIKCSSTSSTTLLVSWRPPPLKSQNGLLAGYRVHYQVAEQSEGVGDDVEPMEEPTVPATEEQVLLQRLDKWTLYRITVSAYTVVGPGPESEPLICRTDEDVPGSPPRRVEVEVLNSTALKVMWRSLMPGKQHGQIRGYQVHYVRVENGESRGVPLIKDVMLADAQEMVIGGLKPDTTYSITVAAYTTKGDGARSKPKLVVTKGAVPGRPILSVTQESETSALVRWDSPDLKNGMDLQGYRLQFGRKDVSPLATLEFSPQERQYTVGNVHRGATYLFKLSAKSRGGFGEEAVVELSVPENTPGGYPQMNEGSNVTCCSVQLSWLPPVLAERNGVITEYTLAYKEAGSGASPRELHLPPNLSTFVLNSLKPNSAYDVKIRAHTIVGPGPYSPPIQYRTVAYDPTDVPKNFTIKWATKTTVVLAWKFSESKSAYKCTIEYNRQKMDVDARKLKVTVTGLRHNTTYEFKVTCQESMDGGPRHRVVARTAPLILVKKPKLDIYAEPDNILTMSFPPVDGKDVKNFYVVVVPLKRTTGTVKNLKTPDEMDMEELLREVIPKRRSRRQLGQLDQWKPYITACFRQLPSSFTVGSNHRQSSCENKALEPGQEYVFFLMAELNTTSSKMFATSPYTDTVLTPEQVDDPQPIETGGDGLIWVVGPVLAVVFIICIVIAILLYKNRKRKESEPRTKCLLNNADITPHHPTDPVEMRRINFQTPDCGLNSPQGAAEIESESMMNHPPIPISELAEHTELLKANDNLKLSQEYESIDPGQQFTWEHSNLEVNKPKNRYANVIAYDHSRVILAPIEGITGSDYINANYIDGYRKQNAYIATQGPLPETFGDFWRMVWEQRAATVVMMTRLEEKSRIKCDQYWPSRGTETYGMTQVTLLDTIELATFCVRTFSLHKNGSSEKREVRQFQFTAWPDHGVPEYPTPFLAFLRRVKTCNPPDAGPIIAHCSAGVGRTGCFIVIDAMLERIKHEKTVDIYGHVTLMRSQRNYMVQTEDQYSFIHDALLEAVACGNTEVAARSLYSYIQKLAQVESGEHVTGMELEFKRLANSKAHTSRFISANLPCNKFKNRLVNIMPYETTRVCLQPIRGLEGSDYINSSFIDGYRQQKAYIATQGPLAETTEDFWRMLWENNSTIVVMLTKLREMGREKCHQYWPAERSARYQYFVVDPMAEYNMPQYILREFKVTDARDGQSRTVRQFQFTDWPEQGVPKSGEGFIDFIGQVHKTKEQFGQDGPISVHCSAGVGRTGVFITLSIVLERMRYEGVVDIFQTVKMLRTQRPAMVQTEDEYQFCYHAALEYLGSFDHYAT